MFRLYIWDVGLIPLWITEESGVPLTLTAGLASDTMMTEFNCNSVLQLTSCVISVLKATRNVTIRKLVTGFYRDCRLPCIIQIYLIFNCISFDIAHCFIIVFNLLPIKLQKRRFTFDLPPNREQSTFGANVYSLEQHRISRILLETWRSAC